MDADQWRRSCQLRIANTTLQNRRLGNRAGATNAQVSVSGGKRNSVSATGQTALWRTNIATLAAINRNGRTRDRNRKSGRTRSSSRTPVPMLAGAISTCTYAIPVLPPNNPPPKPSNRASRLGNQNIESVKKIPRATKNTASQSTHDNLVRKLDRVCIGDQCREGGSSCRRRSRRSATSSRGAQVFRYARSRRLPLTCRIPRRSFYCRSEISPPVRYQRSLFRIVSSAVATAHSIGSPSDVVSANWRRPN